jgi:hypothetical protein
MTGHEQDEDREPQDSPEDVAEASQHGWAPVDKWRGDPKHFVSAKEFARRAREHLPVVNSLLTKEREARKKQEAEAEARRTRETAAYDARIRDMEKRLNAVTAANSRAMELQKAQIVEEYEQRKRSALNIDDPELRARAYDDAEKRERAAIKGFVDTQRPVRGGEDDDNDDDLAPARNTRRTQERDDGQQKTQQLRGETVERAQRWMQDNAWINDPALAAAARAIPVPASPDLDFDTAPEAHLDYIKRELERRFPGATGAPRASAPVTNGNGNGASHEDDAPARGEQRTSTRHSAVESGGGASSSRGAATRERGYKELPAEAKAAIDGMIANKRLKGDPKKLRDEYTKNYWAEYGE